MTIDEQVYEPEILREELTKKIEALRIVSTIT